MEQEKKRLADVKSSYPEGAVIFGAGGHARELCDQMLADGWIVKAFVDDFDHDRSVNDVPVLSFDSACARHSEAHWFIAIGDHKARRRIANRLEDCGLRPGIFVSSDAYVSPSARLEQGVQIFARSVVSSGVRLGHYVITNFSCVLSHDVEINSYVTISPGVHIAGNVNVKEGTFIGIGACIKNGNSRKKIIIGVESIVGAGACVVNDVDDGSVVVGVPAKQLGQYR